MSDGEKLHPDRDVAFRLLDLPLEIRSHIYHCFYSTSVVYVHVRHGRCRPYCQSGSLSTCVNLLLTSRQVHSECRGVFYEAIFAFTTPGLHGEHDVRIVPKHISLPMRRIAVQQGVADKFVQLRNIELQAQFPKLEYLKVWMRVANVSHGDTLETIQRFIRDEKSFRWCLLYRANYYQVRDIARTMVSHGRIRHQQYEQYFTALVDSQHKVKFLTRVLSDERVYYNYARWVFGLDTDDVTIVTASGDDYDACWNDILKYAVV